jgi:DNA-binding beta-propeller fold protein YncE
MKSRLLVVPFLFAIACGDNALQPPADAGVDSKPTADAAPATPRAVAVAGDFTAPPGTIGALLVDSLTVQQGLIAGVVTDDPQLRKLGGKLYVINRDTNNITGIDATTFAVLGQLGTGAGSNPQDVAVVGDTLFVPVLGGTGVVYGKLDDATFTAIDLASAVGDPDGHPDCTSAIAVGTDVYVGCGDLDNFSPRGNGVLVVIDATTKTVRTHVALPVPNPQALSKMVGPDIVITTYDAAAGCTIKVTPGATPTAACLTMNSALGGQPIAFDVSGTTLWFAYSAADYSHSWARSYDTTTATYAATQLTPDTQAITDIAACPDGKVIVMDAPFGAAKPGGFRVYHGTSELTTAALPLGIKPVYGGATVCY